MGDAHGHGHGHHPAHAHHFDTLQDQVEAGKLGMWLFLATEVLLFAGLFCAYTVYRYLHPEVFVHASQFLDTFWGAFNTVILIASSFTVALAVRCAQTNNRNGLILCLVLTLAGAAGFLVVKYIEYSHKFHEGLVWGLKFDPKHEKFIPKKPDEAARSAETEAALVDAPVDYAALVPGAELAATDAGTNIPAPPTRVDASALQAAEAEPAEHAQKVRNVHIFFGIYFCMTGLHGLHVVFGMIVLTWILLRSMRGDFSSEYFLPVDLGGLYWHLVDLIWIYLFPLLYLIG